MVLFLILLLLIGIALLGAGCFQMLQTIGVPFKNPKIMRQAKLGKMLVAAGFVCVIFSWWTLRH